MQQTSFSFRECIRCVIKWLAILVNGRVGGNLDREINVRKSSIVGKPCSIAAEC